MPPAPQGDGDGQRGGREQGLLDEVAAVVDRGRGEGEEGPRGERGRTAEPGPAGLAPSRQDDEQGHGQRAGERGDEAQRGLVERGEAGLPADRGRHRGEVIEGRPVVVARVERVAARLHQFARLHALVGLVRVHRPAGEVVRAEPERQGGQQGQREAAQEGGGHASSVGDGVGLVSTNPPPAGHKKGRPRGAAGRKGNAAVTWRRRTPRSRSSGSARRRCCRCCRGGRSGRWRRRPAAPGRGWSRRRTCPRPCRAWTSCRRRC